MIKTHKPRGHIWSNASAFQQTKGFRNIVYEECTPPFSRPLVHDPDDALTEAERAAKRRKIEKLADDFLNGEPLYISSARPCPQKLKEIVVWNKKSWNEPKFELPDAKVPNESSAIWEDVPADADVLQKAARRVRSRLDSGTKLDELNVQARPSNSIIESVQAQASCGRVKSLKRPELTARPSEEALKQAAALRSRRTDRAISERADVPGCSSHISRPAPNDGEARSEPRYPQRDLGHACGTSVWLSRRQSLGMAVSLGDAEDSADELRLSGIGTPTTPSRQPRLSTASPVLPSVSPLRTRGSGQSKTPTMPEPEAVQARQVRRCSWSALGNDQASTSIRKQNSNQSPSTEKASYHTAQEDSEVETKQPASVCQPEDDSQTRLLRSQGIQVRPRRSWASVNNTTPTATKEALSQEGPSTDPTRATHSSIRRAMQKSAQLHAGKATKSKRTKSAGGNTPQLSTTKRTRSSAPKLGSSQTAVDAGLPLEQQRCMGAFRPEYTSAEATQGGSTPFMFRKKTQGLYDGDARCETDAVQKQSKARRRGKLPSSDSIDGASKKRPTTTARCLASNAPVLDMSFEHDSSFAPDLNMALVDEHLNKLLPAEPGTVGRSSSIKKAIRSEMRNSGARFTRCAGEPANSSQTEEAPKHRSQPAEELIPTKTEPEGDVSRSTDRHTGPSQLWPGTQAMLNQAQLDLFTSPEKQQQRSVVNDATPHHDAPAATAPPTTGYREPLKQLSQEPMPSTQVMLGAFEGFSTVKKPSYDSPGPTPCAFPKATRRMVKLADAPTLGSTSSDLAMSSDDPTGRRSSLRFSLSSADTPPVSTHSKASPFSQAPKDRRGKAISAASIAPPIPTSETNRAKRSSLQKPTTSYGTTQESVCKSAEQSFITSQSFTSGPPLPSFQAAQEDLWVVQQDSEMDRTIHDLTETMLGMTDMDGILSQVG